MKTDTQYAPPERADWEALHQQLTTVGANRALQKTVFSVNEPVLVLNAHRQIVYANAASQALLCPDEDPDTLYGCRPGEVVNCVHAGQGFGGCGTSQHCRICGAVNAVLKSLTGKIDMQQCTIHTQQQAEPMEFILFSIPLYIDQECFALITILQREDEQNLGHNTFAIQRMVAEIESC